jgi:hypothetical protein
MTFENWFRIAPRRTRVQSGFGLPSVANY